MRVFIMLSVYKCMYVCLWFSETFSFYMPKIKHFPNSEDSGFPLFLTPFINEKKVEEGRKNCTVSPLIGNLESYAGYLTVRSTLSYQSHLFFWFFPAEVKNVALARLVLSLQGGTGVSSILGIFEGIGPYYLDLNDGTVKLREHRLTQIASVLYIDSPVGSGYSFTEDKVGHSYNKDEAAQLLFIALKQFFILFPIESYSKLFICGESFASNYIPPLVQRIHWYNTNHKYHEIPINIHGIMLGSMFSEPVNMSSYVGCTLHHLGIIDLQTKIEFQKMASRIYVLAKRNDFVSAYQCFDEMINGRLTPYRTLFQNVTGFSSCFNYRNPQDDSDENYHEAVAKFIQSHKFRQAIHVGNCTFNTDCIKIMNFITNDIMTSVQVSLQYVLRYGIQVLIYHGQYDTLIPYSSVVNFVQQLDWSKSSQFESRRWFLFQTLPVGYFKKNNNLIEMLVLNAGHIISKDQPQVALEITRRFMYNKFY